MPTTTEQFNHVHGKYLEHINDYIQLHAANGNDIERLKCGLEALLGLLCALTVEIANTQAVVVADVAFVDPDPEPDPIN